MDLLASYLSSVKVLLPRRQRDDIVAELTEELRSQIEEREEALGRPLTEAEQSALFEEHGDPIEVARRYRTTRRSLALGWELIGPDLFPVYKLILAMNISLAVLCTLGYAFVLHTPVTARMLAIPVVGQLICVTLTFTIFNAVRRRSPRWWLFVPPPLAPFQPIPRWLALSGSVVWGLASLYWLAVPRFPALVLGGHAGPLELTPVWDRLHGAVLLLLLLGLAQRLAVLARPTWTWLVPTTRVVVNLGGVAVAYLFFRGYPFVRVAPGADLARHAASAEAANGVLLWAVLSWVWIYFLIMAILYARFCLPYLRRWREGRRERAPAPP